MSNYCLGDTISISRHSTPGCRQGSMLTFFPTSVHMCSQSKIFGSTKNIFLSILCYNSLLNRQHKQNYSVFDFIFFIAGSTKQFHKFTVISFVLNTKDFSCPSAFVCWPPWIFRTPASFPLQE